MSLRRIHHSSAALAVVLAAVPACSGGDVASAPPDRAAAFAPWPAPSCDTVHGTGAVSFTRDEGAHLAPTDEPLSGVVYTMGLVTLDLPGHMLAASEGAILASIDSGCTWTQVGEVSGTPHLIAAGSRAYGFVDNDTVLIRVDLGATVPITKLPLPALQASATILGLGIDPTAFNGTLVRVGDSTGQLWQSSNAGATWVRIGVPALSSPSTLAYRVAFDPGDPDHALVGAAGGARVTFDGGATWEAASGLSDAGNANVFQIAISPADATTVWAQAIDLADPDPLHRRKMYRSTDGGTTFTAVFSASDDVVLSNGPTMVPHPTKPDVLYFVFGSPYADYGTWLYRYDDSSGEILRQHNTYHGIYAIAFQPGDPTLMYLGLSVAEIL
jgi:hypothetical protein